MWKIINYDVSYSVYRQVISVQDISRTAFFRCKYAIVEDLDEPFERVLIHSVDILQIGQTKV